MASSAESGSHCNETDEHLTPVKKKKFRQIFVDAWLRRTDFRNWLEKRKEEGVYVPYCKVCTRELTCSLTGILRHMQSKRHIQSNNSVKDSHILTNMWRPTSLDSQVKSLEIKLCAFIVDNNLPIVLIENMVEFLKCVFPNDPALDLVQLKKQKATNIIRQVLGFAYLKTAVATLQQKKFSIIIDETTDQSAKKQLAILATYFDIEVFAIKKILIDMVAINDCTANGLYQALTNSLNEHGIPMENVIGYSSDTTNVMFGEQNSVSQLLRKDIKYIRTVKCSCHLIHLASSYAALKLPKSLEDLCRDIYSHFHRSSKRQDTYRTFQSFFDVEPHHILSPGQTRWLSLQLCVDRILEQYDPLKDYFATATRTDPSYTTERIHATLCNVFSRAYLEFLSYQLQRLNEFNKLFQNETPLLHILRTETQSLIRSVASDFMKIPYVKSTDAKDIDASNESCHVPLQNVYIGVSATATLREIQQDVDMSVLNKFLNDCKAFLQETIIQIQKRFDLNDEIHDIVECVIPERAYSLNPPTLSTVVDKLPFLRTMLNVEKLDYEWRQHVFEDGVNGNMPWKDYWSKVMSCKTHSGEAKYQNLMTFVSVIATYPFSNAAVERIFSLLKIVKSDLRNSMKPQTLLALLQVRLGLKDDNITAASLVPDRLMLSLSGQMKSNATDAEAKSFKEEFLKKISRA